MDDLLLSLPKAELHVHIEGTLEPELVLKLAKKNNIDLPYKTIEDLRQEYDFENLQDFLNLYYKLMKVLYDKGDFKELTIEYMRKAFENNIRHVEIFCDPQVHMKNGVPFKTIIQGITDGLQIAKQKWNISAGIIICFVRDLPIESAHQLWSKIKKIIPQNPSIIGIGLDSAELNYPPELFKEIFAEAKDLGIHRVAHAGEEASAEYIWQAIDTLNVQRIDHGISAVQDKELIKYLSEKNIPLTICPLSNIRLKNVPKISDHPAQELIEQGIKVTINSDDPSYFGGYITDNYKALNNAGVTLDTLQECAKNSIEASFADKEQKIALKDEIEQWYKILTK